MQLRSNLESLPPHNSLGGNPEKTNTQGFSLQLASSSDLDNREQSSIKIAKNLCLLLLERTFPYFLGIH
jgi:hypothetical protein